MESADNTQNEKTNGQGQPVQYYTNAINIMCYYIMKKAASHDLTKNGIKVFLRQQLKTENSPTYKIRFVKLINVRKFFTIIQKRWVLFHKIAVLMTS